MTTDMVLALVGLFVLVAMLLDVVFGNPSVLVTLAGLPGKGYRWQRRARAVRRKRRYARRERREAERAWLAERRKANRARRKAGGKPEPARAGHAGTGAAAGTVSRSGPRLDAAGARRAHTPAVPLRSYRGHLPAPFTPCRGDLEPSPAQSTRTNVGDAGQR